MKTPILIAAGSFLVAAAVIKATPALAEPVQQQNVSIVHTSDLDLSRPEGRQQLNHRLVAAAYEVCGTASDADLAGQNAARACRTNVLAKARAQSEQLASRADGSIRVAAAR
jgi:UrcA family protein